MSKIPAEEPRTGDPDSRVLEQAADWLVRLNEPTATQTDFAQWQAWLAEKPAHARAFAEIQDTWQRSASVSQLSAVQPAAISQMRQQVAALFEKSGRQPRALVRGLALAAAVLLAAVGTTLWQTRSTTVETATAELRSIRLPDGSRAALGPETRLKIDFSENLRLVTMISGEAYFEIVPAPARPFSVRTPAARVVAVGTAFSVHATQDRVAVAVTQGSVRVEPAENPGSGLPIVVVAGQRLVRDHTKNSVAPLTSTAQAVAWQQGRLEYQGEPLRVVVSDLNRYSTVKLRIADPTLGELRYTGTVFPDALDAWAASIEGVFPVRIESKNGQWSIVRVPPDGTLH